MVHWCQGRVGLLQELVGGSTVNVEALDPRMAARFHQGAIPMYRWDFVRLAVRAIKILETNFHAISRRGESPYGTRKKAPIGPP